MIARISIYESHPPYIAPILRAYRKTKMVGERSVRMPFKLWEQMYGLVRFMLKDAVLTILKKKHPEYNIITMGAILGNPRKNGLPKKCKKMTSYLFASCVNANTSKQGDVY